MNLPSKVLYVRHTHTDLVIHHDDAPTKVPRPRAPFSAAIMAVFDDYTEMNGATKVIPRSHRKHSTWSEN